MSFRPQTIRARATSQLSQTNRKDWCDVTLLFLLRMFHLQIREFVNWRTRRGQRLEWTNLLGHWLCLPARLNQWLVGVFAAALATFDVPLGSFHLSAKARCRSPQLSELSDFFHLHMLVSHSLLRLSLMSPSVMFPLILNTITLGLQPVFQHRTVATAGKGVI